MEETTYFMEKLFTVFLCGLIIAGVISVMFGKDRDDD